MSTFEHPNIRAAILGERVQIADLAAALGVTPRAVYTLVDRHKIPFVRACGRRFYDPAEVKRALENAASNSPGRGRGRPRKAAA